MNIHAKSIRYFDTILRSGSIREAARRLHVDGSAVNRQLLNLEGEIGAALFERLPGGLRLTEAGQIFSQHVVTVLQDEQRTLAELELLQGVERGEIRVAAAESLNADFLPAVLENMLQRYPKVRIHTFMLGSEPIAQQVSSGEVDVGVAFAMQDTPDLTCAGSGIFRLGAIMAPDHPLAACKEVSFDDCAAFPLIMANPDFAVHSLLLPLMQKAARPVQPVVYTGAIELMRQLAMRGVGIAFQTRIGLKALCENRRLAYVPLRESENVAAHLGVYVRSARALPPAVTALIAIMNEQLGSLQREEAGAD
ncbi:LysR family transcriptional regulator [Paraburkholderia sp.]|uniref:LysR family transcriptional regulator n=1 Tax=Paraburkholderia sp. TaxID=1926495 RepID=UPI002D2F0B1E|nr:LysR family transcriptional regulator [Paraburkholderia sp.]HZZ03920.1 LysR family transcriptional regulator [Paraburkholderia sp.]